MRWEDITVHQFQEIYALSQYEDIDEFDISYQVVKIVYNLTDRMIESLPMWKFNKYRRSIGFLLNQPQIPGKPPKRIKLGFKRYKVPYDPKQLSFGQYIDLAAFSQNHIENMHLILGTILRSPNSKDAVKDLNKISGQVQGAEIVEVYHAMMLFMNNLRIFNSSYSGLLGSDNNGDQPSDKDGVIEHFNKRYGWIYSAKQVSEFKAIPLDQVYELNIAEAFNYLSYLKAKGQYDKAVMDGWRKQ